MKQALLMLLDQDLKQAQKVYEEHWTGCFRCCHGGYCEKGHRLEKAQEEAFFIFMMAAEEVEHVRAA